MYPSLDYQGLTSSSSSSLVLESTQIRGLQQECVRDLEGDHSVLSYGSLVVGLLPRRRRRRRWGGALGRSSRSALLSIQSSEWNGTEWNWPSPNLGSDLSLYSEVGWVQGGLGVKSMVYMRQSPRGCYCGMDGPWCCRGVRGALGAVRLLCPDALTIRGCRLGLASTR